MAVACASCGGQTVVRGAGGGGGSSAPSCGPDFATPNYARENDPGTGAANRLFWWREFPLRVAFSNEETFDLGGETIGSTVLIEDAIRRWGNATGGAVGYNRVGLGDSPQITVRITRRGDRPRPGQVLGETRITFRPDTQELVTAEVNLFTWPGMTRNEILEGFQATALHEFGHATFLNGHSTDSNDVMSVSSPLDADRFPTVRDSNTLRTAYCGDYSRSREGGRLAPPLKTILVSCPR